MFNVFINDGTQELPPDDILYIVAKDGTYLKKRLGIMESIAPVKNISILEGIETMAKMHINKIPASMMAKTIEFFREVNNELNGAEAIVIDYYNIETGKHKIDAPFQKVSGASLDYTKPTPPEGWNMAGTIHSHNTMSAFHSSIDASDEKYFDGLHITIGNVDEEFVSVSASIVSNGTRFMVEPEEYIEGVNLVVDIDEEEEKSYGSIWRWDKDKKKMVEEPSKHTYKVHKFDKRYDVPVSDHQKRFNKKWMKRTEYETPSYRTSWYGNHGGYGYYSGGNGWSSHFDKDAWKTKKKETDHKVSSKTASTTTKETTPAKEKFTGKIDVVEVSDSNPCLKCAFKDHKIEWVLDQMEESDNVFDGKEYWECMKCQVVFTTEEDDSGDAVCPECKSDMYLMEASPKDFGKQDSDGSFYCDSCGTEASIDALNDGECPVCSTLVLPDQSSGHIDVTDEQLHLLEVNELERIPIPESNSIPLNKPKGGFLKGLFTKGKK